MEMHEKHGTPLNGHEMSHQQGGDLFLTPQNLRMCKSHLCKSLQLARGM